VRGIPVSPRLALYLLLALGQFCFTGTLVTAAFDYTQTGLIGVAGFFTAKFIFSNFIFLPLLFLGLKRFGNHPWYLGGVFFIQVTGVFAILAFPGTLSVSGFSTGLVAGLILSLISESFWMAYHALMLSRTTRNERGYQVSAAALYQKIGTALGSVCAGIVLYFAYGQAFIVICSLLLLGITGTLLFMILRTNFNQIIPDSEDGMLALALQNPALLLLTIFQGALVSLNSFFAPVWMKMMGFTSILTGTLIASEVLVRLMVSRMAGTLYHGRRGREISSGALVQAAGWTPWVFFTSPWIAGLSALFWSAGSHLMNVGLDARWYDLKTLEAMAVREMALGAGRIVCFAALVLLTKISMTAFFLFAIALCLMLSVFAAFGLDEPNAQEKGMTP